MECNIINHSPACGVWEVRFKHQILKLWGLTVELVTIFLFKEKKNHNHVIVADANNLFIFVRIKKK